MGIVCRMSFTEVAWDTKKILYWDVFLTFVVNEAILEGRVKQN
jgi:hypothetical protein